MQPGDEPYTLREIWPAGTIIKGDYVIERRLGGGGFGIVYLARHRFLGTTHVIKRLHEQYASDAEYVRKFVNEGRAIRRLKACPNIVEVEHMTQSEDGHLILVMEHITGGDLGGMMESRTMPVNDVIEYGRQIAVALQAAHQAGLIHRDIKPQNVLVSQDSTGKTLLKLIDFGIAADHESQHQTSVMRGGSVGYAAPEQWVKAGKELDGRCDLYALGVTMYRLLTGRMPYPESYDIGGWIERVRTGPPEEASRLREGVPGPLSDLIQEMLSLRPEGRPADAGEVAARLASMQTGVVSPQESTLKLKKELTSMIAPVAGRRSILLAGGAVVALAFTFGAWKLMPKANPTKPAIVEEKKADVEKVPVTVKPLERKPEAKTRETEPSARKVEQPKPESKVDHAALGDKARDAGDYRMALQHYKALGDAGRFAGLQKAIEGDAEERATGLMDHGRYDEALSLLDVWLRDLPGSRRLQQLRTKIARARDSQ